jgi:small-conductance mechanosensitive channel
MNPAVVIIDRAGEELGGFLPRFGGAIALLVVGLIAVRVFAWLLRRGLNAAGVDRLADRWGVHDALERIGMQRSLVAVTAKAVRIALSLVVIFAAVSLLGLQFLSESLNQAVLFLPKLLVALALLLAGAILSGMARERVDRMTDQMDFPVPLGQLAQISVLAVFTITAFAQIAISSVILLILLAILLSAVCATLAIAFGLGGREMARALNAGRFVSASFELGQTVSVGELRGKIIALESSATILESPEGRVRVPNHLLVESPVTIHS